MAISSGPQAADASLVRVPAIRVPSSVMFAHPSRLVDAWVPAVEQILLPEFTIPECTIRLNLTRRGETLEKLPAQAHLGSLAKFKRGIRMSLARFSSPSTVTDSLILDCRAKDTNNIAHIIQDVLLRIETIKNLIENTELKGRCVVVVLPKRASSLTRRAFDFLKIPTLITDGPVRGDIVEILKDDKPFQDIVYGLLPRLSEMPIPGYSEKTPRKIFISRRDTRKIINEGEVEEYLSSQGYQKLYFDELPFNEQWSISRNATDIVAIHGAALGSLAFNRCHPASNLENGNRAFRLTELFSAAFVVDPFRRYAAALGGSWTGVRGQISPEIVKDLDYERKIFRHAYDPFRIDLTCLRMALEHHAKL